VKINSVPFGQKSNKIFKKIKQNILQKKSRKNILKDFKIDFERF